MFVTPAPPMYNKTSDGRVNTQISKLKELNKIINAEPPLTGFEYFLFLFNVRLANKFIYIRSNSAQNSQFHEFLIN